MKNREAIVSSYVELRLNEYKFRDKLDYSKERKNTTSSFTKCACANFVRSLIASTGVSRRTEGREAQFVTMIEWRR